MTTQFVPRTDAERAQVVALCKAAYMMGEKAGRNSNLYESDAAERIDAARAEIARLEHVVKHLTERVA